MKEVFQHGSARLALAEAASRNVSTHIHDQVRDLPNLVGFAAETMFLRGICNEDADLIRWGMFRFAEGVISESEPAPTRSEIIAYNEAATGRLWKQLEE